MTISLCPFNRVGHGLQDFLLIAALISLFDLSYLQVEELLFYSTLNKTGKNPPFATSLG